MYPVGVGRTSTPTPTGFYKVQNKEVNPTWIDPDDTSIQIASARITRSAIAGLGFMAITESTGRTIPVLSAATSRMAASV